MSWQKSGTAAKWGYILSSSRSASSFTAPKHKKSTTEVLARGHPSPRRPASQAEDGNCRAEGGKLMTISKPKKKKSLKNRGEMEESEKLL